MSGPNRLWTWLSDEKNRGVLAFLGAGAAAVIAALWQLYIHFGPQPAPLAAAPAAAPTLDARGLEALKASQQRTLKAETGALDDISRQIEAAGGADKKAPSPP